ncbi:MAG TPA: lipase family protein [Marmoricola sp.]|jgi:pimeloyl-ACP methyl ester carboxylesterase|nr:lipase family protein [Marmoricola sp.]
MSRNPYPNPNDPGYEEEQAAEASRQRRLRIGVGALVLVVIAALGAWFVVDGGSNNTGNTKHAAAPVPKEPGRLISAEPYTQGIPGFVQAWKILYTTTRDKGVPAVASALVMVAHDHPAGPRPVIAWAHGTTGIAEKCAPTGDEDPVALASIPDFTQAIDAGWAIVATDYTGLGTPGPHPYLVGQGEGRSVLDSVRAAHELTDLQLQDKTIVWGHSQGGGAALWAGILAPTYAPDAHVIAVAGIAPADDLPGLVNNISTLAGGQVFAAYLIKAYSEIYPDVKFDSYVKAADQASVTQIAGSCIAEKAILASLSQTVGVTSSIYARDPLSGPLGKRLRQNVPTGSITVPLLIAQGLSDNLVLPNVQAAYVAKRCADPANGPLDYETYAGRGHTDIIVPGSGMLPRLLAWTVARFAGTTAPSTC